MPTNVMGEVSWPRPSKRAGQLVLEYENHFIFYLRDELYHSAGLPEKDKPAGELSEWEKEVVEDGASSEGIGLNQALYKIACKSQRSDCKDFIVYNNTEDKFYKLEDHGLMVDWVYQERHGTKTLMVTPLEAYSSMRDTSSIDSDVRELNPSRF